MEAECWLQLLDLYLSRLSAPCSVDDITIFIGLLKGDFTREFERMYFVTSTTGAISIAVNDLEPGVQYFYKVSGNTSCVQSPWSNWEGDKPVKSGSSVATPGVPVTGPETIYLWGAISLLMIISGFGLFTFAKRRG